MPTSRPVAREQLVRAYPEIDPFFAAKRAIDHGLDVVVLLQKDAIERRGGE